MFVPDDTTLEQLDQQAAKAVEPFLLGLSPPSCTSCAVAFHCSQVYRECASVVLPDGSSSTSVALPPSPLFLALTLALSMLLSWMSISGLMSQVISISLSLYHSRAQETSTLSTCLPLKASFSSGTMPPSITLAYSLL